jgi:dihydroneopterin aldolase
MGTIEIEGLTIIAIVGLLPHERQFPQRLYLDLNLDCDFSDSAEMDALGPDTVDYSKLCSWLTQWIQDAEFETLEAMVYQGALAILERYASVDKVWIRARKPAAVPETQWVACSWTQNRL